MRPTYECYYCDTPRTCSGVVMPAEREPPSTHPFPKLTYAEEVLPFFVESTEDREARQERNAKATRRLKRRFKRWGLWSKENSKGIGLKAVSAIGR